MKPEDTAPLMDANIKNSFGRMAMEEALLAGQTECADFLAPLTKMDEEKLYYSSKNLDEVPEG